MSTRTIFLHSEPQASKSRCVTAHPHEFGFLHGVQQADSQMFPFVVHGDHVEGYRLWHSQDDGYYPDERYLDSHPFWNSDPFDTAP